LEEANRKKLINAYNSQPNPIEKSSDMLVGYIVSDSTTNGSPIYQTWPGGRLFYISPSQGTEQPLRKTQRFKLANDSKDNLLRKFKDID
jgi:hypothetical protein